jgi:hypothetical protein
MSEAPLAELNSFPKEGWTVGFHAYRTKGYDTLPVIVHGVTSAGKNGLEVAHISVKSDKIVTGLKIRWYVNRKDKTVILARGETEWLDIPDVTGAAPKFDVQVPGASLQAVLGPLVQKHQLKGDIDVQVMASEAKYLDGSTWRLPITKRLVFAPLRKHHAANDLCVNQSCRLAPDLFSYQCVDTGNEECTNYGHACTSYICDPFGN